MSTIFNPQTKEIFNRLNENSGTDWSTGGGTGEFSRTVSGYDSDSLFYAGNTKLTSGTAGSLTAGQFNLTGTTLTVRLPADDFLDIAADADPDAIEDGHVKGFNKAQTDVITAVAASTEIDVTQVALINADNDNDITVQIYRIESDGTIKALTSRITLPANDTVYIGAFSLKTGEKYAVLSEGALVIDSSITTRSTA